MNLYSNKPMHEFLQDVRDQAVKAGAGWALIEKLDELRDLGSYDEREAELEAARKQGYEDAEADMKSEIDDLQLEIAKLEDRLGELEG